MKRVRSLIGVLLVLVMLGSVVSPVMAADLKEDTKIALNTLSVLKTKAKFSGTPLILFTEKVNKESMTNRVVNFVRMKLASERLDKKDIDTAIKEIICYLKSKHVRSPSVVKIKWLPNGEESLAILDDGKVIFEYYTWFYGTKFVEKNKTTFSVKHVHWSDYKIFPRVFDVYNVYGIKIATWKYNVSILTEISPSNRIPLTGMGYIDGTINVKISTEGYTLNRPAVLIGNGPANGYAFNTYTYETEVKITTSQDISQITHYDHFAAGTGSTLNANNGEDTVSVSVGISLGPLSFSVTNSPDDKFIRASAGDNYGREIKIINRFNPWHLTGLGGDKGVYFDGGYMSFSLKYRVGDDPYPSIGTVKVSYKINYVAVQGALEFHSFGSDSYTASLEFERG